MASASMLRHSVVACALAATPCASSPLLPARSGFVTSNRSRGHHLFYMMYEALQPVPAEPTPLILWMNGGPGASSVQTGNLFEGIGPASAVRNATTGRYELVENKVTWTRHAHTLFVDFPVGVGWSYSEHKEDELNITEAAIIPELLTALNTLFGPSGPLAQYARLPLFAFGESYAGRYLPVLASEIVSSPSSPLHGSLRAIAIGDGWTDPAIQFTAYVNFSQQEKLVVEPTLLAMRAADARCQAAILQKQWAEAAAICNGIAGLVLAENPSMCFYNIDRRCGHAHCPYDMSPGVNWMSTAEARQALGIPPDASWRDPEDFFSVIAAVNGDEEKDFALPLQTVLAASVPVLFYSGMLDFAANYLGGRALTAALPWPGQAGFVKAPMRPWMASANATAGSFKSSGNLTWLEIQGAGHMSPHDKPDELFAMMSQWLQGSLKA